MAVPSVGKRYGINVATFVMVGLQLVGFTAWLVTMNSDVKSAKNDIATIKAQIDEGSATYLTRKQVDDILGKYDQRIAGVESSVVELKTEVKVGNERIIQILTR